MLPRPCWYDRSLVLAGTPSRWLLSTTKGLFVSNDEGDFSGPLPAGCEADCRTLASADVSNPCRSRDGRWAIHRTVSDDSGETWQLPDGVLPDRIQSVQWYPANADLILAFGAQRVALSVDGISFHGASIACWQFDYFAIDGSIGRMVSGLG